MKVHHQLALLCFAVALVFYYFASAQLVISGVLFGFGLMFELAGWRNWSKGDDK